MRRYSCERGRRNPQVAVASDPPYGGPNDEGILFDLRSLRVVRGVARVPETRSKNAHVTKYHGDAAVVLAMLLYAVETMDNEEPWECVTAEMGSNISFVGW